MKNEEIIKYVKAEYSEQVIKEYKGNYLIEALPDIILSPKTFIDLTTFIPEVREEDRLLPSTYRAHMLENIKEFFKPLSYHIEIEQKISRMIRYGYVRKNPYRSSTCMTNIEGYKYGFAKVDSSTVAEMGIFGISGMGKTTLINKVLSLYPQMILHTDYKGDRTITYQIPWLKIETPSGCRIKSLSLNILRQIDTLFGEENYYKKGASKREYEQISYLKHVFDVHKVGLLVIDEIQNIRGIASKESDKIMKFFVELSNEINVPIVLIGTLKALPLFSTEMKNCRRIADSNPMYPLKNDREWKSFIKTLFKLQWTRIPVEATEDLMDILYSESQGITDIAVKLFYFAQLRAMNTGVEKITRSIIKSVANDSLIPLKPLLSALKSNNENDLQQFEDVYDPRKYFNEFEKQEQNKVNLHEKYMIEDNETKNNEEFSVINAISSFLIQAGFDVSRCQKAAKIVIKKYGVDIDLNLLKRYAYENLIRIDSDNLVETNKKSMQQGNKKKTYEEGLIKTFNQVDEKINVYDALKNENYICSDEELL